MGKNKRTPKQQMKYFYFNDIKIKARNGRVAYRKYLRGNYAHDQLVRELELDNPGGSGHTPGEAAKIWTTLYKRLRREALAKASHTRGFK